MLKYYVVKYAGVKNIQSYAIKIHRYEQKNIYEYKVYINVPTLIINFKFKA